VKAAKFSLFDVGVAGALTRGHITQPRGEAFGKSREHFVLKELLAHASCSVQDYPARFWRTKTGLESDFVLGDGETAREVKGTPREDRRDLRSLDRFREDYKPKRAILVCTERRPRLLGGIHILPVADFLQELWAGEVFSA
jgi:uncharacterized protein